MYVCTCSSAYCDAYIAAYSSAYIAMMSNGIYKKELGDLLVKFIYASMSDIETQWNGPIRWDDNYVSYKTLLKNVNRKVVKSRFTVSLYVRECLCALLMRFMREYKSLKDVNPDDNITDLVEKFRERGGGEFITTITAAVRRDMSLVGEVLLGAKDIKQWCACEILKHNPNKPRNVSALLVDEFENFLKILARQIAIRLWYRKSGLTADMLRETLMGVGFTSEMINLLEDSFGDEQKDERLSRKGKRHAEEEAEEEPAEEAAEEAEEPTKEAKNQPRNRPKTRR